MNKLLLAGIITASLSASSSAVILTDYTSSAATVTNTSISDINWGLSLYKTGINFSYSGWSPSYNTSNIAVGIYNFTIGTKATDVLCVELTAESHKGDYSSKKVSGYAGWLVSQIATIKASGNADWAAALAIATWEIDYDSAEYNGTGSLNLSSGNFILNMPTDSAVYVKAQEILTAYDNDNTKRDYRYYHNPTPGSTTDYQDYIGAGGPGENGVPTVPGPAAVVPFAIGFLKAIRRRK